MKIKEKKKIGIIEFKGRQRCGGPEPPNTALQTQLTKDMEIFRVDNEEMSDRS